MAASASYDYDIVIIGGGPTGASAVSACAILNRRVAVIDPRGTITAAPTGTISKAFRAAALEHAQPESASWSAVQTKVKDTVARAASLTSMAQVVVDDQTSASGSVAVPSPGDKCATKSTKKTGVSFKDSYDIYVPRSR